MIPCLSSIQMIGRVCLHPYLSCFLHVCECLLTPVLLFSKWLRKKQFIGVSFKFLYFYYLKECVLFEKRLCFKPKYIHFAYSFVPYVTFSSSCLCRLDQFVVFFSTRSTRRSVHTSANLIFYFSNKNGKRKYYLSLLYLHILKYRKK